MSESKKYPVKYIGPAGGVNPTVARDAQTSAVMEPGETYNVSEGLARQLAMASGIWEPGEGTKQLFEEAQAASRRESSTGKASSLKEERTGDREVGTAAGREAHAEVMENYAPAPRYAPVGETEPPAESGTEVSTAEPGAAESSGAASHGASPKTGPTDSTSGSTAARDDPKKGGQS